MSDMLLQKKIYVTQHALLETPNVQGRRHDKAAGRNKRDAQRAAQVIDAQSRAGEII